MARLEAGDKAPAFTLPDQDEQRVSLSGFKGAPVVVYFYPADDTPGCTKEACQFNDNLRAFDRVGGEGGGHLPGRRRQAHQVPREVRAQVPAALGPFATR